MDFTVTFSEAVTVDTTGGTPRIPITLDTGGTLYADYLSGSGTDTLTFRYTPTSGVQDLTGIVTGTAIQANGGTIRDAATNNAALAINAVEPSTAGIDVDAIAPAVTSVGVPANATYIAGQDLDFTVNLDKNVTVDTTGGTPYITLTLDTGGTVDAQYISGSGTSTLTFRYVVVPGNADANGVALGSALVLNGGTISDSHSNAVTTTLNAVASTSGVLVDAVAPTVSSIVLAGPSPSNASTESFTVTFSEPVTGVVAGDFTLHATGTAAATIASVTPVSAGVYTVTINSVTGDGTLRLDLNGSGTGIADLATNPIAGGYTAGQSYTIDHTAPTITAITVPANATYGAGQTLDFTVTFSEPVTVTGSPRIALTLANGVTVYATYVSGSGGQTLTFRHTIAAGETAPSGISTAASIDLNGGAIADAAGNAGAVGLGAAPSTGGVIVDAGTPVTTTTSSTSTATSTPSTASTTTSSTTTSNTTTTRTRSLPILPLIRVCKPFSVDSVDHGARTGVLRIGLTVPCAGTVEILETAGDSGLAGAAALQAPGHGRYTFASVRRSVGPGPVAPLVLQPGAKALRAIAHAQRKGKALLTNVWISYIAAGGTPITKPLLGVTVVPAAGG